MGSKVKIGVCGFPASKKRVFESLDVVEVQQTFYSPPSLNTLKGWRDSAPYGFEFTVKAWQVITHPSTSPTYRRLKSVLIKGREDETGGFRWTSVVKDAYREIVMCCEMLEASYLLFQTPASFKPVDENIERMINFFKKVDRKNLKFVWEPRGNWDQKLLRSISDECSVIIGGDPLKGAFLYGTPLYIRLHGREGYRYRYTDSDFDELIEFIGKRRAYVLFNNVYMLEDAISFRRRLE